MKMNALAEHPKIIAEHQILRENVKCNAPVRIIADNVRRCDDELVPENPKKAAESEGREHLCVNANPRATKRPLNKRKSF